MTPTVRVLRVGRDAAPVAVIDDFDPDPAALRAAAADATFVPAGRHYPGLRAPLPAGYLARHAPLFAQVLRDLFGVTDVRLLDASFSLVTLPPAALGVEQRLPHVDALEPGRIALVHYMSDDPGGTAFFRHRASGHESLDAATSDAHLATLNAEVRGGVPAAYPSAATPHFEQVANVPARFNRAILYRSAMLHSGVITRTPVAAPLAGRLTVTGFLAGTVA